MKASPREMPSVLMNGLSDKLQDLENAVTKQGERFAAVLEIGAALSTARDIDDLLKLVLDRVAALLGAEAATLFMLDEQTNELWSRVLKGSTLKEIRVPANEGIVGHVVKHGDLIVLEDAYADGRFNPEIDRISGFKTRSIIAAPLRHVSGRVLGVIEVLHRKVAIFTPEDAHLVEAVASQIAGVLDNVLLLEDLKKRNGDLDLLFEVEKAMTSAEKQADVLDTILGKALEVSGASAGSILLSEDEQGTLYFRSARGEKSEVLTAMRLTSGKGIAGYVAQTGERIRLDDAEDSAHYDRSVAKKLGVQLKEILCVPIPGEQDNLGALELLNKKGGFTAADERIATLLAGQTGRAILQRRAREEGERKARLANIGQMLSGVMHDLRTPMTIISGYVQLLAIENDPAERQKYAETVEKQFEHLNAMTRETLAFARGERELFMRKVYLNRFMEEVGGFLRKDFEGTGVELKLQTGFDGIARFDENKMKRVIYNIARNAAQAMKEQQGARFTMGVDKADGNIVFRFSDNGPGIPVEIADKLFGEFVTARKKNGTGLGLAIVKKIAEEHGGGVVCKSRPGKGTTFEVAIPA